MIGILKFKLPEETLEFEEASNAGQLSSVIVELDGYLKGKIKYGMQTEAETKIYLEVREKLRELQHG